MGVKVNNESWIFIISAAVVYQSVVLYYHSVGVDVGIEEVRAPGVFLSFYAFFSGHDVGICHFSGKQGTQRESHTEVSEELRGYGVVLIVFLYEDCDSIIVADIISVGDFKRGVVFVSDPV